MESKKEKNAPSGEKAAEDDNSRLINAMRNIKGFEDFDEKDMKLIQNPLRFMADENCEKIKKLQRGELDTNTWSNTAKAKEIMEKGFKAWLNEYNKSVAKRFSEDNSYYKKSNMGRSMQGTGEYTIYLTQPSQALIFVEEVLGQMSDGWWENSMMTRHDSDTYYYNLKLNVNPNNIPHISGFSGVEIYSTSILARLPHIAERMMLFVRNSCVNPHYSFQDLKNDLKTIENAQKNQTQNGKLL